MRMRVLTKTGKGKLLAIADEVTKLIEADKATDVIPPAYPCDKERVVFIGMTIKDAPDDKLRLFCRELTPARAHNVALFVDGPQLDNNPGLKTVIETLNEAGTNVLTDDIYYVNGGPAIFGGKKISLEERTEIVRWAEAIVTKLS